MCLPEERGVRSWDVGKVCVVGRVGISGSVVALYVYSTKDRYYADDGVGWLRARCLGCWLLLVGPLRRICCGLYRVGF